MSEIVTPEEIDGAMQLALDKTRGFDWAKCPTCGGTGSIPELGRCLDPYCHRCERGRVLRRERFGAP